jgi:hypothetical protein
MSWQSVVTADGATNVWAMQETSGSTVTDSVGSANGSYTFNGSNTVLLNQPSKFVGAGACVYFSSFSGVHVQTGSVTALNAAFTVEWLIQWNTFKGFGNIGGIIQYGSESNFMLRASDANLPQGRLNGNVNSVSWGYIDDVNDVLAGVPYHFAITYDGTNAKLYINGVLIKTIAVTGNVTGSNPFLVPWDFGDGRESDCWMGGLALTRSALSAATVLAHADAALRVTLADTFASAPAIAPRGSQSVVGALGAFGDTATFTTESGEPLTLPVGATGWASFTPTSGGTYQIDTIGSNYDTGLAVYTGSAVNALTLVASDDDSGGSNTSKLTTHLNAGTKYSIQVGIGKGGVTPAKARLSITPVLLDSFVYKGRSTYTNDSGAVA